MKLTIALLCAVAMGGQIQDCIAAPCSLSANFADDLFGEPDVRPDTWGRAGVSLHRITFRPPDGRRVRILRVYGDFLIWPVGTVKSGKFAGALFGLTNTGVEGSARADLAADNTFLYVQVATGGQPSRAPVNFDTSAGGLLQDDHVLVVKLAVWLNNTLRKIHMEPSFTVVYRFE